MDQEIGSSMQKPTILEEGKYSLKELEELKNNKAWKFQDIYLSQLTELFENLNPALIGTSDFKKELESFIEKRTSPQAELRGNYVYFPWSGLLMHTLIEAEQNSLRLNRTRNLIKQEEAKLLEDYTAGVAGLSFGNGIALSLVYSGNSKVIKLADTDIFETTNLNRVRVGLPSVTIPKTVVTAQQVYEINPYADIKLFEEGLTEDNLDDFVNGENKLSAIYDVVDDFSMKMRIRLAARKAKIPVIMLTSLEDSILVDVERFDLDPEAKLFHGLLGHIEDDLLNKKMTEDEKARYAMTIVGPENVSYRNLSSLADVGVNLVSRPHLYSTVSIVCGLASFIAKRIALKEDLPSMRKLVKFSDFLEIENSSDDTPENRQSIMEKLIKQPEGNK